MQAAKTNADLKLAAGYQVYRGFNSTAAAACIRQAAALPNPAGRDNRRKIEATLGTADWVPLVNNPESDPQKIAAVAQALGCTVP